MYAAEILSQKLVFGQEAKLWGQMWNFEENLLAKEIITWHTKKPEVRLFILCDSPINFCFAYWQQFFLLFLYFLEQHLRSNF